MKYRILKLTKFNLGNNSLNLNKLFFIEFLKCILIVFLKIFKLYLQL